MTNTFTRDWKQMAVHSRYQLGVVPINAEGVKVIVVSALVQRLDPSCHFPGVHPTARRTDRERDKYADSLHVGGTSGAYEYPAVFAMLLGAP